MSNKIAVINGPNLNMLGTRQPEVYGSQTLDEIVAELGQRASARGYEIDAFQSNSEGDLVSFVQKVHKDIAGLLINPAAYSHTSIALRDALQLVEVPIYEIHLSNIHAREEFRHHSLVSGLAKGVICGLGAKGYQIALDALIDSLT